MQKIMTRLEMMAVLTSRPNTKITHRLFDDNEYIYLGPDGKVYDENGYLFDDWDTARHNGVRMRKGNAWETGWMIKE